MKILKLLFLVSLFVFFSCDSIVECVINKRPEIEDKSFDVGNVNGYYYQKLTSEIKNGTVDDDYISLC